MSKSKFIIEKFAKLFEQGIISYKDLSEEIVNIARSQRDEIVLRMKISTKEETEVLKKRIEKLEKEIKTLKKLTVTAVPFLKVDKLHRESKRELSCV